MTANAEQSKIWNESAGEAWVTHADHLDATLAHFGEAAIDRLAPSPGQRVVDVGCGTGATTLRLAGMVAPAEVVGVDLSHPMLAVARQRAEAARIDNVTFEIADVQHGPLPGSPFDLAFSRFGVMFFSDPVLAFRRIAEALVPGGQFAFVCFGPPQANPFFTAPVGAAARVLGLTPPPPSGPSPFSLADCDATAALLASAGFTEVSTEAGPGDAVVGTDDDLQTLASRLIEQNPTTSMALRSAGSDLRAAAVQAAADVLAPHAVDGMVRMAATSWIVSAIRS